MTRTSDNKQKQHHYLTYQQTYQNEYYVDYKDYQIFLGKKAKAYKLWYSIAGKGLRGWRTLLEGTISISGEIANALSEKGVQTELFYGMVNLTAEGVGDKLRQSGFQVTGDDEVWIAINPLQPIEASQIIDLF